MRVEREREREREKGCKTLTFGLVIGISMSFDWFVAGRWYVVVIESNEFDFSYVCCLFREG